MENRQYLTGAQAIIATLRAHNVDTIFGIPGVHTLPIYDAMCQEPRLRHILARHEQGAGFMAEGYARVSGRPGVVCTIAPFCFLCPNHALWHMLCHRNRYSNMTDTHRFSLFRFFFCGYYP